MKNLIITGLFIFQLVLVGTAFSDDTPLDFANPEQKEQYMDLIEDLRCLVCQNQSLADSNADLAQDLRLEVYEMVKSGDDNEQIIDYLVARYGDFVLYRPPFKSTTYLLWLGPFIFLLVGIVVAMSILRRQKAKPLDEEERRYAEELLNEEHKDNKE